MTAQEKTGDQRPLDFYHWLAACGMDPNRRRPLGRLAALLMDYRTYLEREVGKDDASKWFAKYAGKIQARSAGPSQEP